MGAWPARLLAKGRDTMQTKTAATVIATRKTFDGVIVKVWSDGGISGCLGGSFPGVPMRCRGGADRIAAAWLFAGEVELYDVAELSALYSASLKTARKGGYPGDVRRAV